MIDSLLLTKIKPIYELYVKNDGGTETSSPQNTNAERLRMLLNINYKVRMMQKILQISIKSQSGTFASTRVIHFIVICFKIII